MALLKKINASTLMETLVATVLIFMTFILASMVLNNTFSTNIKSNTKEVRSHLVKLQYLLENKQIQIPYKEEYKNWNITIIHLKNYGESVTELSASNKETDREISMLMLDDE